MKALIALVLLGAIGVGAYYQMPGSKKQPQGGVRVGASVEEVEKVLGPAQRVLPQFGQEMRVYRAASGRKYVLTFANGELVQIN